MRKLPSSASAGNLRQLVDSSAIYSSNDNSMILPSSVAPLPRSSSDVSLSVMSTAVDDIPTTTSTPSEVEDRGCKKSRAYRHTKFHSMLKDEVGKAYERRMCSHCDAVFSFKGGTTSAALRHLKSAHQELLVNNSVAASIPTREQHSGQADFPVSSNDDQGASAFAATSSIDADVETRTTSGHNADAVADSRSGLQRHNSVRSVASSATSEDGYIARPPLKRKRGSSSDEEEDDGEHSADTHNTRSSRRSKHRLSSSKLTASQVAIVHFLSHYREELPVAAMRLRFAKHLTHDVAEAEMYNVLDPATQLEYVREFAQPPPGN